MAAHLVVMCVETYDTNTDQKVIAGYFINTETCIGDCAQQVQVNPGMENGHGM